MNLAKIHFARGLLLAAVDMAALATDTRDRRVEMLVQRVRDALAHSGASPDELRPVCNLLEDDRVAEAQAALNELAGLQPQESFSV